MSAAIIQATIPKSTRLETTKELVVYEMEKTMNFTVKSGNNTWTLPIFVKGQRIGNTVSLKINQFLINKVDTFSMIARLPNKLITGVDINGIDLQVYTTDTVDIKFIPNRQQAIGTGLYKVAEGTPASQYNNVYTGFAVLDTDGTIKITGDGAYLLPTDNMIWFRTGIQFNYTV